MARPLRIEFAGGLYHVTARGNERKPIYRRDQDRHRFLAVLADVVEHYHLLAHAYVLMGNHYHLLLETLEANLSRAMHDLNGTYAQGFNWSHRRVGHLLQGRYKAVLVQRDAYLLELSRYIHLNPVRARIVSRAEDYPWSSARAYVGKSSTPEFLTVGEVLGHFGSHLRQARQRYAVFLAEGAGSPSPLANVVAQTLLGEAKWVKSMRQRIEVCSKAGRLPSNLRGELPAVRRLRLRPTLAQVISAVASATATTPQRIYRRYSRTLGRAVAIYLANKHSGMTQKDVGQAFGISSFAASKAVASVERAAKTDARLRELLVRLATALDGAAVKALR